MSFNKEQTTIMSLVSKFGCVSMQQLYDLLPEHSHRGIQMLVTQLVKGRHLEVVNDMYLVMSGFKDRYKKKTIDMLWAIIRLTKGNLEEIQEVLNASAPADFIVTVDNKTTYKLMTVTESKLPVFAELLEDRHNASKKKNKGKEPKYKFESYYVLVVTSKDVMRSLKEYDFPVPIMVVYMEYLNPYKPQIKCLKKMPNNTEND